MSGHSDLCLSNAEWRHTIGKVVMANEHESDLKRIVHTY